MVLQSCDGRLDENGVITNDLDINARRQRCLQFLDLLLDCLDDLNCIRPGLPLHIQRNGLLAMKHVPRRGIGITVLDTSQIIDVDGRSVHAGHNDVSELAGGLDTTERADIHFGFPTSKPPTRKLDVCPLDGLFKLQNSYSVCIEFFRVCENSDLTGSSPVQVDCADAIYCFQSALDLLISNLSRL